MTLVLLGFILGALPLGIALALHKVWEAQRLRDEQVYLSRIYNHRRASGGEVPRGDL